MRRHRPVCHGYRAFPSAANWPNVCARGEDLRSLRQTLAKPAEDNALVLTARQQH